MNLEVVGKGDLPTLAIDTCYLMKLKLVKPLTSRKQFFTVVVISLFVSIPTLISIRLAIARHQAPTPQAILTLGGGQQREIFTAEFALNYPQIPIWVSSGTKEMEARAIFRELGVNNRRVYIDRRATDTVTNFTTLVEDFQKQDIQHIYLITDDFHLPRAKAIAYVVLGTSGIAYTPLGLATDQPVEPKLKIIRDVLRSLFWIFTKHTGSSL